MNMRTSEENKNVIKALSQAQAEFKTVSKDRDNPFASSRYATLDAILKEVLPKLNKNGLFLTQEPLTEQDGDNVKIGVRTKIFHESGEWIEYEPLFMILEKGAKMNMAQSAGSVITYAKRYAISAIFGISTDDDNDGVQPDYKPVNDNQKQNNNYQQQRNNQPQHNDNQPQQNEQEPNVTDAIRQYVDKFKEMGVDIQGLYADIARAEGVNNIRQADNTRIFGHMKAYYLSLQNSQKQQQQNAEQGSMLEGRTTNVIDWGNA